MKKTGLTLIELLITISLIGIILIVITSVYLIGFRTFREELSSSTVQSNAQTILDAIILDAKNGMLIEPIYDTYTTGSDTIIIRVPAVDNNNAIIYDGSDMAYDRIIYYYRNNEIHKVTFADPRSTRYKNNTKDSTLDKNVLAMSFVYDPDATTATLVQVNLSTVIKVGNRDKEINITGQARLRNHI